MMSTTQEIPRSETDLKESNQRARSSPPRPEALPPPVDGSDTGVGKLYLDLFGPPALANTADTYFQSFAVLRAILEGAPKHHAHAVLDAAEDVAESHVERRMAGGGQEA